MPIPGFTAAVSAQGATGQSGRGAERLNDLLPKVRGVIPAKFTMVYCGFYTMANGGTGIACYANGVRIS